MMIDAHVHLWDPNRLSYPWLEDLPSINRPFLLKDYDSACGMLKVDAMVFVQCEVDPAQSMDEARWVTELAEQDPRIRAIVAQVPLEKGEGSRAALEVLKKNPIVKGVRRLIQSETESGFCLRPDFISGVQILADYNMSFDICISHDQMADVLNMVRQCPETVFILDHIGKPDIENGVMEPWAAQLKELSGLSNVYCKVSGLITEADHGKWSKEDLKPYIDHVISCFGFDRVIYGGDWPVVTLAGEYMQWKEALDWALSGCTADELKKLFCDNALSIYKMDNV